VVAGTVVVAFMVAAVVGSTEADLLEVFAAERQAARLAG